MASKIKALWGKALAWLKKNWEKVAVFIIENVLPPLIQSFAVTKEKLRSIGGRKSNGSSSST